MGFGDSFLVLLLLTGHTHSVVFNGFEIVNTIVNTNFAQYTQFACFVPNDGYFLYQNIDNIFLKNDNLSMSLPDLARVGCAERPGNGIWRMSSDSPVKTHWPDPMSLIFTSSLLKINVVSSKGEVRTAQLANGEQQLFVYPSDGMTLRNRGCVGRGNVTFYTGAGTGNEEDRFLLKSWSCSDLPDMITSFDNVITVSVESDVRLTLDYSPVDPFNAATVSPLSKVAVMASGLSDNYLNVGSYNRIIFGASKPMTATAVCSPCSFDPQFHGFVQLEEYDEDWDVVSQEMFRDEGDYTFAFQKSFYVYYKYDSVSTYDVWDRQDTFVLELSFKDAEQPPTTTPIIEADPYCGCGLDDKIGMPEGWNTTEIWIDLVIVLDTSEAMGEKSLEKASTLIESLFGTEGDTFLTTDPNTKFYTRVGVIAMSDEVEVLYNLNMTKADKVQGKVGIKKGISEMSIPGAFYNAKTMLNKGRPTNDLERANTRQVVYYMTHSDPHIGDSMYNYRDMNLFKSSDNGIIIINDFIGAGGARSELKEVASEGYYYSDIQENYMASLQLFCKANCFCGKGKSPYVGPTSDPAAQASGGCLLAQATALPFGKAKDSCSNLFDGGRLVSVHEPNKAHSIMELMIDVAPKTFYSWMGYTKAEDGAWRWEDESSNTYVHWDTNEPNPTAVAKCAYLDLASQGLYWGAGNCNLAFPYTCEFAPCSVGSKNC